jgi:uncharacterized protein (TIGR04222 family)
MLAMKIARLLSPARHHVPGPTGLALAWPFWSRDDVDMADQLKLSLPQSSEPWGLSGPQFLGLYVAGLVTCAVFAFYAYRLARRTPEQSHPSFERDLDLYEGAYLAGGPGRVTRTAAFSLLAADRIRGSRSGIMTTVVADGAMASRPDGVAQVVFDTLAQREPTHLHPVLSAAARHPIVDSIGERLRDEGLVPGKDRGLVQRSALLPIVALFILGVARLVEGVSNDRPVLFLLLLLMATVGLGVAVAGCPPPRRTARGDAKMRELSRASYPIRGLALGSVLAIDVALLGAGAIDDRAVSGWLFGASAGGGGGGSGGYVGGDGGGGSCGGGCGGGCGG